MGDFIQSPPDSTGKKVNCKLTNDGVDDLHTPIHMLGDRNDPTKRQSVSNRGEARVVFDGGSPDFEMFGRTTVSEPNLLDMFKFYQKEYADKFMYSTSGTASVARDPLFDGMKLTTGTTLGDRAEMTSHRHFHYRPGNTMTKIFTMKGGDGGKVGLTRQIGWITPNDGIFLEMADLDINVVVRNGNMGTEERYQRSAWNGDRLDGNGGDNNLSGATLDPTKNGIWWISFQYLGAGAVSFGTYVGGEKVTCHTISHYGELDRPYMSTASLPFCVIQQNTATTSTPSEIHVFCVVIYNDGYDELDRNPVPFGASKTIATTSFVPIISFRPTQTFNGDDNRCRIVPISLSALSSTAAIEVRITLNPALTGDTWSGAESKLEYDVGSTVTTGGSHKDGQLIAAGRSETIDLSKSFMINRDGVTRLQNITLSDHITVSARLLEAGTTTAGIVMTVLEID